MWTVPEIIKTLGGAQSVADAVSTRAHPLRLSRAAVDMWPMRGIPGRWHAFLIEVARERGIELSASQVAAADNAVRPKKRAA